MGLLSWPQYENIFLKQRTIRDGGNWEVVKWDKLKRWSSKVNGVSLMFSLFC